MPAQTHPLIKQSRPRVNINDSRFADIKSLLTDTNNTRIDELYQSLNMDSWAYTHWMCNQYNINLCGSENQWTWEFYDEGISLTILKMVLLYYNISSNTNDPLNIDKTLQKKRINFITQEFINYIDDFKASYSNENYNTNDIWLLEKDFRFISKFGPILLDWGYGAINNMSFDPDAALRSKLVNRLWDVNYDFMKYFVYREFFDSDHWKNDYYAGGHALQNNMLNMKMVISLYNTPELTQEKKNALNIRYNFLYDILKDELIPIFKFYADDNDDGTFGNSEGGTHWGGTYTYIARLCLIEYFDLITNGTDKNLYLENPWINSYINQYYHLMKPDGTTLHIGDDVKDLSNNSIDFPSISLFNHFNHLKNHWMMKEYENKVNYSGTPARLEEIILRDFSKGALSSPISPYSKDWFSRKTGTYTYKSSSDEEATMFTFFNAPTNKNNHQHLDNNGFQIFKNGPLIIDSGSYDSYLSDHYLNYYSRTIAHNTITCYDPSEQFLFGYNNQQLSNDGGQSIKNDLSNYSEIISDYSNNSNSWSNYISNNEFTYFISDATSSYAPQKLNNFKRKVLFLKNYDRVIILDDINKPNNTNNNIVKWNIHSQLKPTILNENGTIASPNNIIINNHIYGYGKKQKFLITNEGGGNAMFKTLLPKQSSIIVVGGSGYEYYVDGQNYPPTSEERSEDANWRLEVTYPSLAETLNNSNFINTIEIRGSNETANNTSKLMSQTEESIAIAWDDNLYIFSNEEDNNNSSHLVLTNGWVSNNLYKIYAFDLMPNELYKIYIDNNFIIDAYTNSSGYLITAPMLVNGNILKIIKESFFKQLPKLIIYPNELKNNQKLNIILENMPSLENNIYIYDAKESLIFNKYFEGGKLQISRDIFKKGVYFIVLVNGNNVEFKEKIIVN